MSPQNGIADSGKNITILTAMLDPAASSHPQVPGTSLAIASECVLRINAVREIAGVAYFAIGLGLNIPFLESEPHVSVV